MTAVQLMLIEIITFLSQGVIFLYYATSFFEKGYHFIITIANIMTGYLVLFAVSVSMNPLLVFSSTIIINALLLLLLFQTEWKILIFHSVVLTALLGISELLCLAGIPLIIGKDVLNTETENSDMVYAIIFGQLIYFILVVVICHIFGKKGGIRKHSKGFWGLLMMPLSSVAAVSVLIYAMRNFNFIRPMDIACAVASLLMLISNIVVFFIYDRSLKDAEKLTELMIAQQKSELDKQYFHVIEQTNNDMKMLAHDIKNHFISIKGLDNMEEVNIYIDKLYPHLEQFYSAGNSTNKMLDLIISKYVTLCESNNLIFAFDVRTSNLDYVDDVDLSVILNNLLDNAVEAAKESTNKQIDLRIYSKNKMCDAVVINNSCDIVPITKAGNLVSTKEEQTLHGIGVRNVIVTAEKYNAVFGWDYSETQKIFTATLVFPKEVYNEK